MLLVAHRGAATAAAGSAAAPAPARQSPGSSRAAASGGSHEGAVALGTLPQGVLLRILALAAYPLSAWRPVPDGGSIWQSLREAAAQPGEDYYSDDDNDGW